MAVTKLTRRGIAAIAPTEKRALYYDADLPGFALRVDPTGRATYFLEYRPGAGGRQVAKRRFTLGSTTELSPEEARDRARTLLAEIRLGADPAAFKSKARTVPTLGSFAREHLEAMTAIADAHPEQAIWRPTTIRSYRSLLNKHLGPALGSRQLNAITKEEIKRLHVQLGKTSPATANRCLELVGSLFRQAAEAGHVDEGTNPARGIRAYKERRRERFLSMEELGRLGEAIRIAETVGIPYDPPHRPGKKSKHVPKALPPIIIDRQSAAALRLLIFSGARLREIISARWSEVDLNRGYLTVFGKTGRRHIILPAPALEIVAGLPRTGPFLIPSANPEKPKADLNRPWRSVRRFAGLDGVRIHDLRHSFASVAVSGGASLPMIGRLLGHTQAATTARYAHLADDPVRAAAETIAGTIASAMGGKVGVRLPARAEGAADAA
jgi:integrase